VDVEADDLEAITFCNCILINTIEMKGKLLGNLIFVQGTLGPILPNPLTKEDQPSFVCTKATASSAKRTASSATTLL